MKRKVFLISFMLLGLFTDCILPFTWAIVSTLPILFFCWWLAYKTDWFEE